jgi:hypothetical protein
MPFKGFQGRSAVDYSLRTQQQNHVQLILLADQKANIVLTLTLLVTTLGAGSLTSGSPHPVLAVLVAGSVLAAIAALLALMPKLHSRGRAGEQGEVQVHSGNLFFFGDIARMDAAAYRAEMEQMLAADGRLYDAIAADLYATAVVLKRKYLWLRRSYLVLLWTLPVCALVGLASLVPALQRSGLFPTG